MRNRLIAAALTAAALTTLTGCLPSLPGLPGNPGDIVENIVENTTGGQVDVGSNASVPDEWPSDLPLPNAELVTAMAVDGTMILTYAASSMEVAAKLVAELESRGFTSTSTADFGGLRTYALERDDWNVTVGAAESDDQVMINYSASPRD